MERTIEMDFLLGMLAGLAACYGYMRYVAPAVSPVVAKVEAAVVDVKADLTKKD